jgi:hypothetical protein
MMYCVFSDHRYWQNESMLVTSYHEPWRLYRHPVVRQLAFAIASPNLIRAFPDTIQPKHALNIANDAFWQNCYLHYATRLARLDQQPQPLIDFLQGMTTTRLGLRFEALLCFWLQDPANTDFALLAHSLQFNHQGYTLGEIDFLVQNRHTHAIEHWEVCLKYYLGETDLQIHSWIGLNTQDRLFHKLQHFTKQQFRFQDALGFAIDQRRVVIKGQLFLPTRPQALPAWINPQRRLGYWQSQLPAAWQGLVHLSRQEWLCPHHCGGAVAYIIRPNSNIF